MSNPLINRLPGGDHARTPPRIVVTMPAFHAEETLERTIADIPTGIADELILVDDASTDGTAELARSLGMAVHVHSENAGYGANQKTCYVEALRADADIVVLLHPDYQYDPKAIPLLIAPILAGEADMTFGSRFAGLGDPIEGGMPLYRFIGNRVTTTIENLLIGSRFTDMHSGVRAYTREFLASMPFLQYSDDFLFDSQMLLDAATSGWRVVEIPIPTRYTRESSSIAITPSVRYIAGTLGYAVTAAWTSGRRGRRNPVARETKRHHMVRDPAQPHDGANCSLCGAQDAQLIYPRTTSQPPSINDYRCTTDALSLHDDIVRCSVCGLLRSIPAEQPDKIIKNYEEVTDPEYLDEEENRRELFGWIADRIGAYRVQGERVVEVGANVGLLLDILHKRGWSVRGVEPSMWAVNEGRKRFGVPLRQGTVESLRGEQDSADVVVMIDVLEHLVDPRGTLELLREVVDEEGLLVLSTVDVGGFHARARGDAWPWFIRSHLYYFDETSLPSLLASSGFHMVEWTVVPRSFRLSYLAKRVSGSLPGLSRLMSRISGVADVRIPVGWLGDIVLVVARPSDPSVSTPLSSS